VSGRGLNWGREFADGGAIYRHDGGRGGVRPERTRRDPVTRRNIHKTTHSTSRHRTYTQKMDWNIVPIAIIITIRIIVAALLVMVVIITYE